MENSSGFTCINCNVKFSSAQMQRDHYKSDWHRYNLKRRVACLPPVTAEQFQNRILQLRTEEATAIEESKTCLYCNACHKHYSNQKAHDNHLNGKKHKENLIKFKKQMENVEKPVLVRSIIEERPHPAIAAAAAGKGRLALQQRRYSEQFEDCSDGDEDDFEMVDESDVESEEWQQVAENILTDRDCLFCNHKSEDILDNLKHMSVQHSFFIPDFEYCTDLEGLLYHLGEKVTVFFVCLLCNERGKTFYSLDAVRKHMIDKGHCQMLHEGAALAEYSNFYDYSSSYPDHGEGVNIDDELIPELLDGDEYQLTLPSGAVIGHRSLLRYYRQNLRNPNAPVLKKTDRRIHRVLSEYRALGWTQTQQKAAARKAHDIHLMKRVEAKWRMKLGIKANKLHKNIRQQVIF